MVSDKTLSDKAHSIISEFRKEQIAEASISVINESGYANASLANIAKKAEISTALISYYFPAKKDLTDFLLKELIDRKVKYIIEWVKEADTPMEKLFAYIQADLSYSINRPAEGISLMELIFNARDKNKIPYYQLESDDEDLLEEIIKIIQEEGGFLDINAKAFSIIIKGAIREYAKNRPKTEEMDQKTYGNELISVIVRLAGLPKGYMIEPLKN